ncbi:MAG: gliding motility-associated C-terminal domain-containing protein, partial [Cryomorphaceae bacterium]
SQPLVGDLTWDDGTTTITADTLFIDAPSTTVTYEGTLSYGTVDVQCSVTESINITPILNPLSITCNLPALICEGDDPLPIPSVSPPGGVNFIIDSDGDVLQSNVTTIDPSSLLPDSYHFVYEIVESSCTFRDSCAFDITAPQSPDILPVTDTLCYNEVVDFFDANNLGGIWSSSCPSAISSSGLFDPEGAACTSGSVVEIYYSGNCILNDTLEVFLIEIPQISIVQSIEFPCPGDVVTFSLNPPQSNVNWTNAAGDFLGAGPSIDVQIDSPITIIADADVGATTVSCIAQASISVSPEVNPTDIDCSLFPAVWCTGDNPISIPEVSPGGGTGMIMDDLGNILFTDPIQIQTEDLGSGTFFYVYEITDWGAGQCTFRDSCEFLITEPAIPVFQEIPDSICYNSLFNFNEVSGLSGQWSSSCLGSIDPSTGVFDPSSAACLEGTNVELIYSGTCVENDTLSIYLIPLPEASIDIAQGSICANECLPFSQTITGDFDFYEWTISWADQELGFINENPTFCPDQEGLNSAVTVLVELSVFTDSNPQCLVTETTTIEVIRIPDEVFPLVSPQCLETAISLPPCEECESYSIVFSSGSEEFSCTVPGDNCAPPDTGIYAYELTYDFGACQSDLVVGEVQIVDVPFLTILEAEYDTCAPVVDYSLFYGGYDFTVTWQTSGDIAQTTPLGNDLYETIIDHSEEVEVDSLFTDIITVQNICGIAEESSLVFHAADPDFTLDPDSSIYCQGQTVLLDLGFAQPIFVDSITINHSSTEGAGGVVLNEIPLNDVPFDFDSDSDTLVVNFVVTAFNSCATVSKTLTAFILPVDVSADFDIPFSPPVCIGDSIPIVFNSTGNVDATLRQIETNDPNVEVLQILGNWYLIPQEGTSDGELVVNLTEFGFCGIDFDQETITLGPTLNPEILSEDVCRGGLVTLVPVLEQDADLYWQITPDSTLNVDFPPPLLYAQPGLYYPSVLASADGYCDGSYTDTVEVFDPIRPLLLCDADCDGGQGCSVTFDAVSVCVGLQNPDLFNSFEWYVRRSFFPAAGPEVEIFIDDLVPCEENLVRLVARDENNCRVEVAENIEFTDVLLYAPNAFTPNSDSFNDVFRPVISGAPVNYSMRIFDRWGNLVFETNDPEEPWLGNVEGEEYYADAEVYSYLIEYLPCQPEEEEKTIKRTGMITLIR